MGMLERLSDVRGTIEGKIVAIVLAILLVLPMASISAFANNGNSSEEPQTPVETTETVEAPTDEPVPSQTTVLNQTVVEEPTTLPATGDSTYATIDEFFEAVEVVNEANEAFDGSDSTALLDAIDKAILVYDDLSDVDKADPDVNGTYEGLKEYAEQIRSGNPNENIETLLTYSSNTLNLTVSSYSAPFKNGSTGKHDVNKVMLAHSISASSVGSSNPSNNYAEAWFEGNNNSGWSLCVKIVVGNYETTIKNYANAKVTNKDMSNATGRVTFGWSNTYSNPVSATISISGAKDLPKTFTLNYNANGGNGAPSQQTANSTASSYSFTVSSTEPTLSGYDFLGWSTSSTATSASYTGGNSISVSGTTTLYAVWKEKVIEQVTLTYMDRGMQYAQDTYDKGTTATVKDCTNTRNNYKFEGWDTSSAASTAVYAKGDTITIDTDTTLYAVWKKVEQSRDKTVTIVKTFIGKGGNKIAQNKVPSNFYFDYSYTYGGKTTSGQLARSAATVTTNENGHPTLTWTLKVPVDYSTTSTNKTPLTLTEHNYAIDGYTWAKQTGLNTTESLTTGTFQIDASNQLPTNSIYNYYDKATKVIITVMFVDENGDIVGTETFEANQGSDYDATDETNKIPDGYEVIGDLTGDPVTGTADQDKTINVPVGLTNTVTVKWVDEDGKKVLDGPKTFTKGSTEPTTDVTPSKAEDENNTYEFSGWELTKDADGNVTYKATYTATPKVAPVPEPTNKGQWRLDINKEISNYLNSGQPIKASDLPDDFSMTVEVTYHDGTGRVTESKSLTKTDVTRNSNSNLFWEGVFYLPNWQYDFEGTGKSQDDLADYDTVIKISEANYKVEGYNCTVGSTNVTSVVGNGKTEIVKVEQTGSTHTQSKFGLRNSYRAIKHTVKWVNEDGKKVLDGPKDFYTGNDEPTTNVTPSKPEDTKYTYEFKEWERSEDGDGNVTYTATYTATPKLTSEMLNALNLAVQIVCDSPDDSLSPVAYYLDNKGYDGKLIEIVESIPQHPYMYTVTISPEKQSNYWLSLPMDDGDTKWNKAHDLASDSNTLTATLVWDTDNEQWTLPKELNDGKVDFGETGNYLTIHAVHATVSVTVNFVDETGYVVRTETIKIDRGNEYDVTETTEDIPKGYEAANGDRTGDSVKGTADSDKTINVPVKKTEGGDTNEEKVTVTVEFVDENGDVVSTETVEVDKDSEYDVTEKITEIPEGYEANGDPTGDVKGTADSDKTITVPVKMKTEEPVAPGEEPIPTPVPSDDPITVVTVPVIPIVPTPAVVLPVPFQGFVDAAVDFLQTPVLPLAGNIADDETPLADIEDEETPMSAFDHPFCWVHYYIILGIIITAIYGGGVIARRLGYNHKIKKYEDDVTGKEKKGLETESADSKAQVTI